MAWLFPARPARVVTLPTERERRGRASAAWVVDHRDRAVPDIAVVDGDDQVTVAVALLGRVGESVRLLDHAGRAGVVPRCRGIAEWLHELGAAAQDQAEPERDRRQPGPD